jgi:hypothetical protein
LRHQYDIGVYREGERAERGEATLNEAAAALAYVVAGEERILAVMYRFA